MYNTLHISCNNNILDYFNKYFIKIIFAIYAFDLIKNYSNTLDTIEININTYIESNFY
jgi:hypothetical protein